MAILRSQALLASPSLRALVEVHLDDTFPVRLTDAVTPGAAPTTASFTGGPMLISTDDLVAPLADGSVMVFAQRTIGDYEVYDRTLLRAADTLLQGYWRLGEATGATVAADSSTWARTGAYTSGWTFEKSGPLTEDNTTAVKSDAATTTAVTITHNTNLDPGVAQDFTLIAWVRVATAGDKTGVVIGKRPAAGAYAYELRLAASVPTFTRYNGTTTITLTGVAITDEIWTMIVVRKAGTTLSLWQNGVLVATALDTTGTVTSTAQVGIGNRTAGTLDPLGATFGEIALAFTALSWTVLEKLYLAGQWYWNALWEGRLVEVPALRYAEPIELGGVQQVEQISIRIINTDGRLDETWQREIRDKRIALHLYDVATMELQRNAFVGYVATVDADLTTLSLTATSLDQALLSEPVPRTLVTTARFSRMASNSAAGAAVHYGLGHALNVPLQHVGGRANTWDAYVYDWCVGKGNIGIIRLYGGEKGLAYFNLTEGVELLYRTYQAQDGSYCTAIRRDNDLESNMTADVLRCYADLDAGVEFEWKLLSTFVDDVRAESLFAETYLTHLSGLTLTDLLSGPHGVDGTAGAFRLPGGGSGTWLKWAAVGNSTRLLRLTQQLTVEFWVFPRTGIVDGAVLVNGPNLDLNGTPKYGWMAYYHASDKLVQWILTVEDVLGAVTQFTVYGGPLTLDAWNQVVLIFDNQSHLSGTHPLYTAIYVNGMLTGQDSRALTTVSLKYGLNLKRPMTFGLGLYGSGDTGGHTTAADFGGIIRISGTRRSAREVRQSYYRMLRNPVEALRDFIETEMNEVTNPGTFNAVAAEFQAIEGGILKHDGWLASGTQVPVRAMLEDFTSFLGLRLWRDALGQYRVDYARVRTWDYGREVLIDAPRAYWRFDEVAYTGVIRDSSGWDIETNLTGAGSQGGPGAFTGSSAWTGAGGDYATFGQRPDMAITGGISVEFWIKLNAGTNHTIIDHLASDGGGYTLTIVSGGFVKFEWFSARLNALTFWSSGAIVPTTSVWTYVVATMSADRSRWAVYINGVLAESGSSTAGVATYGTLTNTLYVGALGGNANKITVPLDELALYDYPLSARQVATHYAAAQNNGAALIDAAFGLGGFWNNILEVSRRSKAGTAAAIATLVQKYGTKRDTQTGEAGEPEFPLEFEVQAIGKRSDPVSLLLVRDHETACYLGQQRAARMAKRDSSLSIVVGHEGRFLLPGHVIALDIPSGLAQGVTPVATAHVVTGVEVAGPRVTLECYPQETPPTYVPPSYDRAIRALAPTLYYRLDDEALSAQSIQYWSMGPEAPETAEDSSGNNLDAGYMSPGIIMGIESPIPDDISAVPHTARVPYGSGIRCANEGYVQRLASASLNLGSANGIAFCCWVRFPAGLASGKTADLLSAQGAGSCVITLTVSGTTGLPTFTAVTGAAVSYTVSHTTSVTDGLWHLVWARLPNAAAGVGGSSIQIGVDAAAAITAAGPTAATFTTSAAIWYFGHDWAGADRNRGDLYLDEIVLWVAPEAKLPNYSASTDFATKLYSYYSYVRPAYGIAAIPPSAVDRLFSLDIGDTQELRINDSLTPANMAWIAGGSIQIDVELTRQEYLFPIRPGNWSAAGVLVQPDSRGLVAMMADAAFAPPLNDGNTTYVSYKFSQKAQVQTFVFAGITKNHFPTFRSVAVEIAAALGTAGDLGFCRGVISKVAGRQLVVPVQPPALTSIQPTYQVDQTEFTEFPSDDPLPTTGYGVSTRTGRSWQVGDLVGVQAGFSVLVPHAVGEVRISAVRLLVRSINDMPSLTQFDHVRIYRLLAGSAPPTEGAAQYWAERSLTAVLVMPQATGTYDFYARVYDARLIPSPLIGPTTITFT